MKTEFEQLMENEEFRRQYAVEGLVLQAAERIAQLMENKGVSRADLARRLGKSRAYVTQILSGKANLTVRTLAQVAYALGAEIDMQTTSVDQVGRARLQERPLALTWQLFPADAPRTSARYRVVQAPRPRRLISTTDSPSEYAA